MGNWYRVTKRINGRLYDYWQRTKRIGKSVKTENRYIGPAFGRNDRVRIINTASGQTAERTIKDAKQGYLVVFDDVSGIPYKASHDQWRFEVIAKGDPMAPLPKIGITFKELAEQEAATAISDSVSPTAPYWPEETLPQLTPFTAQLEGRDKRDYERHLAKIRAEDETIQYGKLKDRIKKQDAKVRAARRKTKGIKSLNPFIAQAMLKQ